MQTPDSGGELMALQGARMQAGWMPLKFELGWQGVYILYIYYMYIKNRDTKKQPPKFTTQKKQLPKSTTQKKQLLQKTRHKKKLPKNTTTKHDNFLQKCDRSDRKKQLSNLCAVASHRIMIKVWIIEVSPWNNVFSDQRTILFYDLVIVR